MNLLGAMFIAVVFLGGYNANAVQSVVAIERTVFYRERAAGMYSELPYAFSQVAIETIYTAIQSFFFTILLFSVFGFEWTVAKFFWFYYFVSMFFTYFTMCGMMVVALTPGLEIAAISMSFLLNLWNLFAGFFIPRTVRKTKSYVVTILKLRMSSLITFFFFFGLGEMLQQIPIWWRWYYWASPMAWTIYGLVTSQMGDNDADLVVAGLGSVPLKAFLKETFGFDYDFLPVVALVHVGWVLLFFFVFAYGIKCLNFQKR